jgi:hypothetical protein
VSLEHIDAAQLADASIALLDLLTHVPGAAANLPFVYARIPAEGPTWPRHRAATPPADGLTGLVAIGDAPLVGGHDALPERAHLQGIGMRRAAL